MYENIKILKGKRKGPASIIIGGIHGNETCGVNAVKKIFSTLKIDAGKVIIAFGNPKAIIKKLRFVESNLNRLFRPSKQLSKKEKSSYEYSRMLFLKKYLKQSDFLLDIHASFTPKSRRFIICENNANKIIKYLPFNLVVNGFDAVQPGGTDYHMNKIGKIGICVECGYKDDPKSNFIAEKAIKNFLIATKNIVGNKIQKLQKKIKIYKLYKSKSNIFSLSKKFNDFEIIKKGQKIGIDGNREIRAGKKSIILFAQNTQKIGEEAFLLGKKIK